MTTNGWILIHRKIIDHWIFKKPEYLKAWMCILLYVNYQEEKVLINGTTMICHRGQSVKSLDTWGNIFGRWSKNRVLRFFNLLKKENMIETKNETKTTRLTVCNYDSYQDMRYDDGTANRTDSGTGIEIKTTQKRHAQLYENNENTNNSGTTAEPQTVRKRNTNKELKEGKRKNTLSASSKPDNGFNFETEKQTATEFDRRAAGYLEKAVRRLPPRKTGIAKAKPALWANHICLLRTKGGIEEREIKATLKWYAQHIGKEFVPEAYSGESFRKKYPAILRQCERGHQEPVEITQEARELAERLDTLSWHPVALDGLPAAVQSSLNAFGGWRSALAAYSKKLTEEHAEWMRKNLEPGRKKTAPADTRFAEWLLSVVPGKKQFIQNWFEEVNRSVAGWEGWDGNLSRFIFRPDGKRFQKIGERWAAEFTGSRERWGIFCSAMMKDLHEVS